MVGIHGGHTDEICGFEGVEYLYREYFRWRSLSFFFLILLAGPVYGHAYNREAQAPRKFRPEPRAGAESGTSFRDRYLLEQRKPLSVIIFFSLR